MADDPDRDTERETERSTIVTTDRDRGGSAAIVIAVLAIVILLAVLLFGGIFDRDDEQDLNVEINQPGVNVIVPETQVPVLPLPDTQVPPDVNVNVVTPPEPLPPEANTINQTNTL